MAYLFRQEFRGGHACWEVVLLLRTGRCNKNGFGFPYLVCESALALMLEILLPKELGQPYPKWIAADTGSGELFCRRGSAYMWADQTLPREKTDDGCVEIY